MRARPLLLSAQDLVKAQSMGAYTELPATPEKLHEFVVIGKEALRACQAKLRAIDRIDRASAVRAEVLDDAQRLAELLLDAEIKLGEILHGLPDFRSSGRGTMKRKSLPQGITKKESHQAQVIWRHRSTVEEVKEQAKEQRRLATAGEVLRRIKSQRKHTPQSQERRFQEQLRDLATQQEQFAILVTQVVLSETTESLSRPNPTEVITEIKSYHRRMGKMIANLKGCLQDPPTLTGEDQRA